MVAVIPRVWVVTVIVTPYARLKYYHSCPILSARVITVIMIASFTVGQGG